jgi:hypothetical protein
MLERVRACFKVIRHVRPKQMVRDGADTCTILSQASQLRLRSSNASGDALPPSTDNCHSTAAFPAFRKTPKDEPGVSVRSPPIQWLEVGRSHQQTDRPLYPTLTPTTA